MAIIPLIRIVVFAFATLFSLVVLGICAHLEVVNSGNPNSNRSYATFGIASAGVTAVTLPLFFILGHARRGAFISTVVFEIVWFLVLWVLWVATAGDTVVDRASLFPNGCVYGTINGVCYEVTVVEAFAFLNFFAVFFYYDVLVLYAIICAIRGRGIWTISVRDAANSGPHNPAVAITQPQYPQQLEPQYPQYPGYQNMPPAAGYPPNGTPVPYNAYSQQATPLVGQIQPYPGPQQHQYPGAPQVDNFNPVQNNYSPNAPSLWSSPLSPQSNYDSYRRSYPHL